MNKKIWIGVAAVAVVLGGLGWNQLNKAKTSGNGANGMISVSNGNTYQEEDQVTVTDKGIVYTGKVIPQEIYYYQKDGSKQFNQCYVTEGQEVKQGALLFDYFGQGIDQQKVTVLEKSFVELQEKKDDLYARLAENQQYLDDENKWEGNEPYKNYLRNEISKIEKDIAQNKVDWLTNENQIKLLKEEEGKYQVLADVDGLVYQVNDGTAIAPNDLGKTAYIVVYTQQRIIRIEVSEFEYMLVSEGMEVEIEVEGLKKTFTGKVKFIDTMPNNLDTQDTSYYYVEVEVPEEIPYGYSAIVTVPVHE